MVSYRPDDPSVLHRASEAGPTHNWIGPAGAQVSALAFGLLGLSALLLPLFLIVASWRRIKKMPGERVLGRGLGAAVLLLSLPALLHLTLGDVPWRGELIASGGGLGRLIGDGLQQPLGLTGSLFILVGGVIIGAALLVQSTLGELLAAWGRKLADLWHRITLSWARMRERRSRSRSREKVMSKMNSDRNYQSLPLGSCSLKACFIAEGKADVFLRIGVTGEWDAGASQCIVHEAGGTVLAADFEPLTYNKRETLVNPDFVVLGDSRVNWQEVVKYE